MRKIIIASLSAFALAGVAACNDTTDDTMTETDPALVEDQGTTMDPMAPGATDDAMTPPADTRDTMPPTQDDMTTPPAQ